MIINSEISATLKAAGYIVFVYLPWSSGKISRGWLETRRQLLEFRANPRSPQRVFTSANSLLKETGAKAKLGVLIAGEPAQAQEAKFLNPDWLVFAPQDLPGPLEVVILLYPDPIGLHWERIEKVVFGMRAKHYFVLNGRDRLFELSPRTRRALAWRRWLSVMWPLELLLAPAVILLAASLAIFDALVGNGRN
jgi:hypothetical protein